MSFHRDTVEHLEELHADLRASIKHVNPKSRCENIAELEGDTKAEPDSIAGILGKLNEIENQIDDDEARGKERLPINL